MNCICGNNKTYNANGIQDTDTNYQQQTYVAENFDIKRIEEDLKSMDVSITEKDTRYTDNITDNKTSSPEGQPTANESNTDASSSPDSNQSSGQSDDYTQLLIMFVFLILAFVGYKIFASRKK